MAKLVLLPHCFAWPQVHLSSNGDAPAPAARKRGRPKQLQIGPPASKKQRSLKDLHEATEPASSGGDSAVKHQHRVLSEGAGPEAARPASVPSASAPAADAGPAAPAALEQPEQHAADTDIEKEDAIQPSRLTIERTNEPRPVGGTEEQHVADAQSQPLQAGPISSRQNGVSEQTNESKPQLGEAGSAEPGAQQHSPESAGLRQDRKPSSNGGAGSSPVNAHDGPQPVTKDGPSANGMTIAARAIIATSDASPSSRAGQPAMQQDRPYEQQAAARSPAGQPSGKSVAAAAPDATVTERSQERQERRQSGSLASSSAPLAGHDARAAAQPVKRPAKASVSPPQARLTGTPQLKTAATPITPAGALLSSGRRDAQQAASQHYTPRSGGSPGLASSPGIASSDSAAASKVQPASQQQSQAEAAAVGSAAAVGRSPATPMLAGFLQRKDSAGSSRVTKLSTPLPSRLSPASVPAPKASSQQRSALGVRPPVKPLDAREDKRVVREEQGGTPRGDAAFGGWGDAYHSDDETPEEKEAAQKRRVQKAKMATRMQEVVGCPQLLLDVPAEHASGKAMNGIMLRGLARPGCGLSGCAICR